MPSENHHKVGDIVTEIASFTNRWVETITLKEVNHSQYGDRPSTSVLTTGGMGFGIPNDLPRPVVEGGVYILETHRGYVSGLIDHDGYLFHKSDEHFADAHARWKKKYEEDRNRTYEDNKEDWERRTEALPEELKGLLNRTRESNPEFDREGMGWGYYLVALELAVLYIESEGEESLFTKLFAAEHGTSGNQHDFAKGVARNYREGLME